MTEYYECHLTVTNHNREYARGLIEDMGWTFSSIEDDIVIGPGIKYYATKHYNAREDRRDVLMALNRAGDYLITHNIDVIRQKIELVIHDTRSSKVSVIAATAHPNTITEDG